MKSVDKTLNCILPPGTLTCPFCEYVNTLFGSLMSQDDNVTEVNCHDAQAIHLSNVLTDHFSISLPEKTTEDIPMNFSQYPFKNIFNRLPLSNRGINLQIIHVRRKAIFTFYVTCITCVNNITF